MSEDQKQVEQVEQPEEQVSQASDRVIQLTVKLPESPGSISFAVTNSESIGSIAQTLNAITDTQQYTCFELYYGSLKLSETVSLQEVLGEDDNETEKLTLVLREAAYTEKSAREHLAKVREIASLDLPLFYQSLFDFSGVAAGSSTFSELELSEVKQQSQDEENEAEKPKIEEEGKESETEKPKEIEISDEEKAALLETLDSILNLKSSVSEFSGKPTLTLTPALRALYISSWTPATQERKLRGDLLYLTVQTLEGETYHLTSSVAGFYVNNSSATRFDSSLKNLGEGKNAKLNKSHSLLTLLRGLSPKFNEQCDKNAQLLAESISFTYNLPTNTFLNNPWLVKESSKKLPDLAKTQETYIQGGLEGADLFKDWNDEFQTLRELPKSNLNERIVREKLLNKTTFDFTTSAINGAMAIVRGELSPMNPTEDPSEFIYLRNGIFYSLAVDGAGQFNSIGGNEAARASVTRDLNGVKYLNRLDVDGVYHLCTAVVDYCGKRIVCQTPVPGIFNQAPVPEASEGEESAPAPNMIVYGSSEEATALNADAEFVKKFKSIGEAFHLKPHKAWTKDGSIVEEVVTSMDTKGMKGTDGREYIIDLYRTTPLDIEFIEKHFDLTKEDSYPYREVTLRHEAVEEWWKRQLSVAIKKETEKFEAEKQAKLANGEEVDADAKATFAIEAGSFALNPDAFSLSSAPTPELAEELRADETTVREVSKFVTGVLLPELISDFQSNLFSAHDGTHLTSLLHKQGVNVRYLGLVAKLVEEKKSKFLADKQAKDAEILKNNAEIEARIAAEKQAKKEEEESKSEEAKEAKVEDKEVEAESEDNEEPTKLDATPFASLLDGLYAVVIQEMVARAVKNYLRVQCASLALPLVPYVIAHVHNCLLSDAPAKLELEESLAFAYSDADLSVLDKTAEEILADLKKEVFIRYRFNLADDWKKSLKPTLLLREVAIKFGIQWKDKKYAYTQEELDAQVASQRAASATPETEKKSKKKSSAKKQAETTTATVVQSTTFTAEDIVALVPVIKDSIFQSTCGVEIWEHGRNRVNSGQMEEGLALLNEAVSVYNEVYGALHPVTGMGYGQLGQICAELNRTDDACNLYRNAFQVLERTSGVDSYDAILTLNKLATIETSNESFNNALKIYKRLLSHWNVTYGEANPNTVTTLSTVAIILQRLKMFKEAGDVFQKAVKLSDLSAGEVSQMSGLLRYQLGQSLANCGSFKEALVELTKAYEIFKVTLGLDDRTTKEAGKWTEQLNNYLVITKKQQKYLKEVEAQNAKKARKLAAEQAAAEKANGKKNVSPNPEIAEQSIEDILKFIEGNNGAAKSSKKSKKKGSKK
ncbi:hypothetical protein CANARDRAFT_30523 [[Candida] arabinofermentans NRRL YB-2248]|uniref:Clu domain-containing protein n=1 Tax=[Candida] arabinofermentans NRRL YB-2248 TaxID=983967 RepID=A0A1E4STG9_9ASCO|nr:hypothetical protein CANARDRAFT_30523 [[Candida] arabinofermentans NRRL YB-2248]